MYSGKQTPIMIACVSDRITASVTGSILGFFSGVVTDFKPSAPLMIISFATLGVVVASLVVLVLASYGPGPARVRPQ